MFTERMKKNDLELAGVFINFHDHLVNFAQYNQEELSPLAERTLCEWLGHNRGISHLDCAQQLKEQGVSISETDLGQCPRSNALTVGCERIFLATSNLE